MDSEIGRRIKLLRGTRGETQLDLAKCIGVSREVVQHWEDGNRHIKANHLILLASHFLVTTDYLLGISETKTNNRDVAAIGDYTGLDSESISILRNYKHNFGAITFINCTIHALTHLAKE